MSKTAYLALLLDAPLQSWGFSSRFQRRTTALHPTKSGVAGMICAALGIPKGSADEQAFLAGITNLKMSSITIPRSTLQPWDDKPRKLPLRRLDDFHTVLDTRRASGKANVDPVVTRRQYLLDARFGVILEGDDTLTRQISEAIQNPKWGIWFGRKSCIPAAPVFAGIFESRVEAEKALIGDLAIKSVTRVSDVASFDAGTDSLIDQPVSFGPRKFTSRRILIEPGGSLKESD
jgi:CRISPR system Cascade subunit CasD